MLILSGILISFQSLKDKTFKIVFVTNEPTPDQLIGIHSSLQNFGYLAFKEDKFRTEEKLILEDLESDYDDKSKTPSKRLKNVLFVKWKQNDEGFDSFNNYYISKMEKFIEHIKSKLE